MVKAQEYLNKLQQDKDKLESLDLASCNLTGTLNLKGFIKLKLLNCSDNQLTILDVSDCPKLKHLELENNKALTHLYVADLNNFERLIADTGSLEKSSIFGGNSEWIPRNVGHPLAAPLKIIPTKRNVRPTNNNDTQEKLNTARQKLAGKIPWLSWETKEGLEKWIKELETELENIKNPTTNPNPNPQPDNNVWNYTNTKINDNTYKYKITLDGEEIDFSDFITSLRNNNLRKNFFQAFQGALKDANSKFPGYFWKCPPVSQKTLDKPFEFVVIKTDSFNNIAQNPSKFQEHFGKSQDNQAVSFSSPSGNVLISPVPKGTADYINISQFTKNAPDEQQQALWQEVANSLMKELEKDADAPRWLNTEGTGVYYLHVRIDKTARFYENYEEYKNQEDANTTVPNNFWTNPATYLIGGLIIAVILLFWWLVKKLPFSK